MKILILTWGSDRRIPSAQALWNPVEQTSSGVTVTALTTEEIKTFQKHADIRWYNSFDQVLVDLPFKYIHSHAKVLKQIKSLWLYEEDICQNFLPFSKWYKKFSRYYAQLPHAKIIVTGYHHALKLRETGVDSYFVPKGYDANLIHSTTAFEQRDIAYGFIGRTESRTYKERKRFLSDFSKKFPLHMLRTASTDEYLSTLNRIQYFVSADIGFNEYMSKNYEAMAAGCLLVAKRVGLDAWKLGFRDMDNTVLYDDLFEAVDKLNYLKNNPEIAARIADNGQKYAAENFSLAHRAKQLLELMTPAEAQKAKEKL